MVRPTVEKFSAFPRPLREMHLLIVLYHFTKLSHTSPTPVSNRLRQFPITNLPLNKRKGKHRKTRPNRRKRKSRMMETSSPLKQ